MSSIFDSIAARYELINHLLTLGLDMPWRRRAARIAVAGGGGRWLDICAGTGEMASALRSAVRRWRLAPRATTGDETPPCILAADASLAMLQAGERRCARDEVTRLCADATCLPFPDASFDLVTMAFAARNVDLRICGLETCFREVCRVLRPGGRFVNLETSHPPGRLVRWMLHTYASVGVERLGRLFSGTRSYAYLAGTIPGFHDAGALAAVLSACGFTEVVYHRLSLGIVAVHVATRRSDGEG